MKLRKLANILPHWPSPIPFPLHRWLQVNDSGHNQGTRKTQILCRNTNSFVLLPSNPYSSRQQIIRNLLSCLAEIESAMDILAVSVAVELEKLPTTPPTDTFPLRHHHAECVRIQTDLSKVVYTVSSVTVMKHQVSDKVDGITKSLEEAKLSWIKNRKISKSRQEMESAGINVSTGKTNHDCVYYLQILILNI